MAITNLWGDAAYVVGQTSVQQFSHARWLSSSAASNGSDRHGTLLPLALLNSGWRLKQFSKIVGTHMSQERGRFKPRLKGLRPQNPPSRVAETCP
jgi:hypothetical protein